MRRHLDAQQIHVIVKFFYIALGDVLIGNALFIGAVDDLVVNIGIVAHKGDFISAVFQIALYDVKDNHGAGMADMG